MSAFDWCFKSIDRKILGKKAIIPVTCLNFKLNDKKFDKIETRWKTKTNTKTTMNVALNIGIIHLLGIKERELT